MKIYRLAKQYNKEIMNRSDFAGFHCQKHPRSEYDDIILNSNNYAEKYYRLILDALPYSLRDKAYDMGLFQEYDEYSDEFDEWVENVYNFLRGNNIRWIFLSNSKPLSEHYGDYRYYVLMPREKVLEVFDDPDVNDMAWAYLYDANQGQPECIELDPEEEGYDEDL